MKVKLQFSDNYGGDSDHYEKYKDLFKSIKQKICSIYITLSFLPLKNMYIDLAGFNFDLNEEELDLFHGYQFYKIDWVTINSGYIELWLKVG